MAEFDGRRVAAVFAADTAMKLFAGALAELNGSFHKFAYALGIEPCKRVEFVNLCRIVRRKELACVVTREAEGHLREVVGAEAEELGLGSDFVGGDCRAGNLYHSTNFVVKVYACRLDYGVGSFNYRLLYVCKLFNFA